MTYDWAKEGYTPMKCEVCTQCWRRPDTGTCVYGGGVNGLYYKPYEKEKLND